MSRIVLIIAAVLIAGCTHPRVTTYLPSDPQLECDTIRDEIRKAEASIQEIDRKTGLSWRNAGLVLVSIVGVAANEINGNRERSAAEARITYLRELARQKQCPL